MLDLLAESRRSSEGGQFSRFSPGPLEATWLQNVTSRRVLSSGSVFSCLFCCGISLYVRMPYNRNKSRLVFESAPIKSKDPGKHVFLRVDGSAS